MKTKEPTSSEGAAFNKNNSIQTPQRISSAEGSASFGLLFWFSGTKPVFTWMQEGTLSKRRTNSSKKYFTQVFQNPFSPLIFQLVEHQAHTNFLSQLHNQSLIGKATLITEEHSLSFQIQASGRQYKLGKYLQAILPSLCNKSSHCDWILWLFLLPL